jgi:hypothetical protein
MSNKRRSLLCHLPEGRNEGGRRRGWGMKALTISLTSFEKGYYVDTTQIHIT